MHYQRLLACSTLLAGLALGSSAAAQDLAISRIGGSGTDFHYYGQSGGIAAYSFGTTSCNVGDQIVLWETGGSNPQHPVIAQNFFRMKDNRFEHLGYSFLKHSFCAVNETSCGSCQGTNCDTLGIGCADTYGSGLNDGASGGTKSEIQPTTGYHTHPYTGPSGSGTIRGRLQVQASEMANSGATYIAESQYVSEHDQGAGNGRNNVSWRELVVSSVSNITSAGSTQMFDPAIYAWQALDSNVTVTEVRNENEGGNGVHGHYFLGAKNYSLGGGLWRYEYALQNMDSAQAAGSFSLPISCDGLQITDLFFRDVNSHSGDPYDSTDWSVSQSGGSLTWSTTPYSQNQNANALRWGTLYNFGFTANSSPANSAATIGLFAPGVGSDLQVSVKGPCGAPVCGTYDYCAVNANSTGNGAVLGSTGSVSIAANDLQFFAYFLPANQFGIVYYGTGQTEVPFGNGNRCVGGSLYRLPIVQSSMWGDMIYSLDNSNPPAPSGQLTAGSTWNFQYWFRDPNTGANFNLSNGHSITFCP
ncbi:MAG: hypothetical protein QF599_04795 [Planctomycetota bacterium]|nr:hypothetical protein [Planctomycetota bacterium]